MTLLIFLVVFLTVVIIHELGHFFASKAGNVDVEEFAVGLPPRAFRYWKGKGSVTINGQRVEIPSNLDIPIDWRNGLNKEVIATMDKVDEKYILRTIQLTKPEPSESPAAVVEERPALNPDGIPYVTYGENPVKKQAAQTTVKPAPAQPARGAIEMRGVISEIDNGTEYTINWLPLGGFVRPKGENDPSVPGGLAASSPWIRLGVLLAGPAMNLIAGVLIYTLIFAQTGVPVVNQVVLVEVSPNSPAAAAGFLAGDLIVSANGEAVTSIDALKEIIQGNLDQPVTVAYERNGVLQTTTVTPSSQRTVEEGATGVLLGNPVQEANLLTSLSLGIRVTGMYIHEIVTLPARLIQGAIPADQARFVGLKGMYDFMSQAVTKDQETRQVQTPQTGLPSQEPTYYTLSLIAALTISLGIFNLLPFPALDGGRIIFLLPELIFRKRVPPRVENMVHAIGITLLLVLMLYINVMDFVNPVAVALP